MRLDDEDLDDEDRAILAEVAKKGYYHGRPKSEECAPPVRIEQAPPSDPSSSSTSRPSRAVFDEFQAKWDRFDRDGYLEGLEVSISGGSSPERVHSTKREEAGSSPERQRPTPHIPRKVFPRPIAEFRILLAGDGGVGKTALLRRHLTGEFSSRWVPTGDLEVHDLRFRTNCGDINFQVWELACAERRYRPGCIRESWLAKGEGAIVMFDVTCRLSYRSVPSWLRDINKYSGIVPTVLVANKADAPGKRPMSTDHAQFGRKRQLQSYSLSLQDWDNIEKPFRWLARRLTNQPGLKFVGNVAFNPQVPRAASKDLEKEIAAALAAQLE